MAKKSTRKSLLVLERRLKSFVAKSGETKVLQRWANGGFRKPGSQNSHKVHSGGRRK